MGVKGLWDLVSPVARKVKLESLAGTRLAVDASIWLHQFLKAMRDKEGNALQNAHTLGFFRRICKLLFFNVKPVFVFDGGVPELKRQTMVERRKRRTGQVNNLAKTAEKLLAAQMKMAALKEAEKKRQSAPEAGEPDFVIENPVYFDYLANSPNKHSGKRDEYYLPSAVGREIRRDDPRLADDQELEEIIVRERRKDETQNVEVAPQDYDDTLLSKFSTTYPEVDLSRLDLNSDFFRCLPIEMQQELLIELKLRSRQTSHARLQEMVRDSPDAMSFSMAQIKQLMQRNDLTQKVMNMNDFLSGVMDEGTTVRRIAGEKRKQYVLVKNDAGRTGWSMGATAGSDASQPVKIDVDDEGPDSSCETSDEDALFEEVAVPSNVSLENFLDYEQESDIPRLSAEELHDLFETGFISGKNESKALSIAADRANYVDDSEDVAAVLARFQALEQEQFGHKSSYSHSDPFTAVESPPTVGRGRVAAEGRVAALSATKEEFFTLHLRRKPKSLLQEFPSAKTDMIRALSGKLKLKDLESLLTGVNTRKEKMRAGATGGRADAIRFYYRFLTEVLEWRRHNAKRRIRRPREMAAVQATAGVCGVTLPMEKHEESSSPVPSSGERAMATLLSLTPNGTLFSAGQDHPSNPLKRKRLFDPEDFDDFDGGLPSYPSVFPFDKLSGGRTFDTGVLEEEPAGLLSTGQAIFSSPAKKKQPLHKDWLDDERARPISTPSAITPSICGYSAAHLSEEAALMADGLTRGTTPEGGARSPPANTRRPFVAESAFDTEIANMPGPKAPLPPGVLRTSTNETSGDDAEDELRQTLLFSEKGQTVSSTKYVTQIHHSLIEREKGGEVSEVRPAIVPEDRRYSDESTRKQSRVVGPSRLDQARDLGSDNATFPEHPTPMMLGEAANGTVLSIPKSRQSYASLSVEGQHPVSGVAAASGGDPCREDRISDDDVASNMPFAESADNGATLAAPRMMTGEEAAREEMETASTMLDTSIPEAVLNEQMTDQMDEENAEFARFVAEMASQDLQTTRREVQEEMAALNAKRAKERRDADDITGEMIAETQELLRLFGIPFITAPMEAEAQCACLMELGLVDGIITDDSDVFLFGGSRVYKNFFNQAKFVECFLISDLERELNLNRESLVSLAFFTGSDYTAGIHNVGPVIAMEIMGEFPGVDGVNQFAEWWRTDVEMIAGKKGDRAESSTRRKLRRLRQKLDLPEGFPDPKVWDAYLRPVVDTSDVQFEWGVPDLAGLREFLTDRLNWTQKKADSHLLPVIRQLNQRKAELIQTSLDRFFDISAGFGPSNRTPMPHRSVRVQNVVKKMKVRSGTIDSPSKSSPAQKKRQKARPRADHASRGRGKSGVAGGKRQTTIASRNHATLTVALPGSSSDAAMSGGAANS